MSVDPRISECLDLLSDTDYREQASKQLDVFPSREEFSVNRTQIYGLRQIARQQPKQVAEFAKDQRKRAKRKLEMKGKKVDRGLEAAIEFWKLVANLCDARNPGAQWSVAEVGEGYLPNRLHKDNTPEKRSGMSGDEGPTRKEFNRQRREWLERWNVVHVPAFFERFCTHALYRLKPAGTESREGLT